MSVKVFQRNIPLGSSDTFHVKVAEYADGTPIKLLIRVLVGEIDGPKIGIIGLQHGDEYSGVEIANRVINEVNPKQLKGTVIAIPVSNPLAFNSSERTSPLSMGYENLNMNRVWPGDPKGLLIERIVAEMWGEVVRDSNVIIDLHEGGKAFMARYIHARGTPETDRRVGEENKKLYKLFGQGVPVLGGVNTRPSMMGTLSIQTGLSGIPSLSPELGGGGRIWEELVHIGVEGIRNVLRGLDMLEGELVGQGQKQLVSDGSSWPKTNHGGIMYNSCELGAVVKEGELLGELRDTAGRLVEECRAPYRSIIFDTRWQPTIYPGDWTFHCGKLL